MIKPLLNQMKITSPLEPRRVVRRLIGADKSLANNHLYQDYLWIEPTIYLGFDPLNL